MNIGVHIADVTHYLDFLSPLDIQISKRATTIYMTDNVYHMLPKQLCEVCSLLPGQDKLAFSVIWEMTQNAEIVSHRFAKTVIRSCCQMAYRHAQEFIENPKKNWPRKFLRVKGNFNLKDLSTKVNILHSLAIQMRDKRFKNGALRIDQPKLHVTLDPITRLPISYSIEELKDSNRLIEEFMLLANMTVATYLYDTIPDTALLRNHREPSQYILNTTKDILEKFGIHLDIESSASLHASIKRYEEELESENNEIKTTMKYRMMVINNLCSKAMARATYKCSSTVKSEEDLKHYALNVSLYTHFTSPIRRYSDCVVHRLLYWTMQNITLPETWSEKLCKEIAANCNLKKYNAKMAQERSNELYFTYLIDLNGPIVTMGIVLSVTENFIDVILCHVGIKLRIFLSKLKDLMDIEYSSECSVSTIRVSWKQTSFTQDQESIMLHYLYYINCFTKGSDIAKVNLCKLQQYCLFFARFNSSVEVMKVLNVAEKNDAAKNIAGYLSRGTSKRREGLSPYNKIYEFKSQVWNQNCDMIMTSVSGHLLDFQFVSAYRKWQSCHPLSLFDAPVTKQCIEQTSLKIKETLEREVKKCNALIIWTDCDREGENIGFEIIQVCQAVKPNISVYRAKFSEITQASINRALQNLCEPNKAVNDAVDVRMQLDLRIGAAFTRFQTLRLQKVFPRTLSDMLISYGSCQFPTLGFVVERYLAVERFKPEPYWKISVKDTRDNISVDFRWARGRLFEKLPCEVFLDMCLEQPNATVQKVTSKPTSKWRPVPLDTVELEKQGSRKLRLTAKQTMKIAEKLYTQGFISYPRTETNIFPKELNLVPFVNQQVNNPLWGNFAQQLLEKGLHPRQGKKSDQAHPPIHPTKCADNLQGDEAKVYEFVVRHFLACLSDNAIGRETVVEIDIAGEKFVANGLQIIEKNYLNVYIYEKWSDKEIYAYQEGQVFRPTSIDMIQEETSPPQLLTEADLISLMDKYGIGTDATHAEHIDTIKSRQYVGLMDGKHLIPGKLGIGLVMGYDSMGFEMSKPKLRAGLEKDLKLVCEGQKSPAAVLETQINTYREVFKVAMERANLIDSALADYLDERPVEAQDIQMSNPPQDTTIFKCPKCGLDMILKEKKQDSGKFIGCINFPTCNNTVWFPQNVESVEVLDEICSQCSGNRHKLKFKLSRNAFPLYGTSYTTCIGGCDPMFNEALNIKNESVKAISQRNESGYYTMSEESRSSVVSNSTVVRYNETGHSRGAGNKTNLFQNNTSIGLVRNQSSNRSTTSRSKGNTRAKNQSTAKNNTYDSTNNSNPPTVGTTVLSNESTRTWGHIDDDSVIVCKCNETAMKLTVRKEGPNQGRVFYKCARRGAECDFFLWESDDTNQTQNVASNDFSARLNQSITAGPSRISGGDVKCHCNQPAVQRTVQKEGPNKGRLFYSCPKGMNDSCNFFQWMDENNENFNNTFSGNSRKTTKWKGEKRENTKKQSRPGGGKRKCGICGVEGHTRKTCPENVMD
nr:PREDICTED: DNA topoisomerase 3-alpha isoform X3 [Megachile rotundata]